VSDTINRAQSQSTQWSEMAILITVDEDGGFYDSASSSLSISSARARVFPMIAVSPFQRAGTSATSTTSTPRW
jgi:phospholipase C